jgi:hypothetical protein
MLKLRGKGRRYRRERERKIEYGFGARVRAGAEEDGNDLFDSGLCRVVQRGILAADWSEVGTREDRKYRLHTSKKVMRCETQRWVRKKEKRSKRQIYRGNTIESVALTFALAAINSYKISPVEVGCSGARTLTMSTWPL